MDLRRGDESKIKKQAEDFADLQNEIAGNEVGKISRFLSAEDPRSATARRKKDARRAAETQRFLQLMTDPAYRALYEELGNRLQTAERTTDQAIDLTEKALQNLSNEIFDMETSAAKGPDGMPVFKTADGRVVDAHGEALPAEIAAGIIWPANAPTAESYFAAQERREALGQHLDHLNGYRTDVLGSIRHRYEDTSEPMEKDDLRQALDDIEAMRPELSTISAPKPSSVIPVSGVQGPINVPSMLN